MWRMLLTALMGVLVIGCQQDSRRPLGEGEAETHWLLQCQEDADCGSGVCVCGVCTESCGAQSLCEVAERPVCAPLEQIALACGEQISACVRECEVPRDCGSSGFDCRSGVCVSDQVEPAPMISALTQACAAVELRFLGNRIANAEIVLAQYDALQPQFQAALGRVVDTLDAEEGASLLAANTALTRSRSCGLRCGPPELDAMLSQLEILGGELAPLASQDADELQTCIDSLARRIGALQFGLVAAICGDGHSTARLVRQWAETPDSTPLEQLCATRAAHDACQVPYRNVPPLTEAGRCPSCTVEFEDTQCALSPADSCGTAGECLCEAAGLEGQECEGLVFGPRGAIAFGEACEAAVSMGSAVDDAFDDQGLAREASAGCALLPAVLESRLCNPDPCADCESDLSWASCEPGHSGCEIRLGCAGARFIAPTLACDALGGLCRDGWTPVETCVDDQPCEPARDCGIDAMCQPAQP